MNTQVSVTMFPALKGDSFLITYGTKHILIDCGYSSTYHDFIKDTLSAINERNERVERLIITHIDADHISGAIDLLTEKVVEIGQIWHNTYRHLQFDKLAESKTTSKDELAIKSILARGLKRENKTEVTKQISARQGTALGSLILKGKYNWNTDFQDSAVSIDTKSIIQLGEDSTVKLLSPDRTKLEKLAGLWVEELKKIGIRHKLDNSQILDDAFEFLMSYEKSSQPTVKKEIASFQPTMEDLLRVNFEEDKKITNGSSIAFVLVIEDKELLFLGDSHPGIIEESLKMHYVEIEYPIQFDLIKVSHHGAFNNTSPSLLNIIDSSLYLFSTNGSSHSHPDKETIAHIVTRPTKLKRTLAFNYRTKNSEYFSNPELMEKYNYGIIYTDVNMPIKMTL